MKEYLISIVAASLIAALLGILAPEGSGKGLSKHVRLLSALFLLCVLITPLKYISETVRDLINGNITWEAPPTDSKEDYDEELKQSFNASSKVYFAQLLLNRLETEFKIPTGEVRCSIQWENEEETRPLRISIILSGSSVWRDPKPIENYVEELLGCECVSAIE